MIYLSAVDYLYGLRKHGIKLGLENTRKLFAIAGNPHEKFKIIHVAGTNGKGSVSTITAYLLRACGFRTALFTSPHLVSFTERIRIDDSWISESETAELTSEIREMIQDSDPDLNPTFFEFVTAMAFIWFARKGAQWAVIETGMGGRMDSTNIVQPEVSVITTISYDHKEFLGDTLDKIAFEKAGIIKSGAQVVSAPQRAEAEAVLLRTAEERGSRLSLYGRDFFSRTVSSDMRGSVIDYIDNSNPAESIDSIYVPFAGDYQPVNAALAIRVFKTAIAKAEGLMSVEKVNSPLDEIVRKGVASARIRGRLEIVSSDPLIIVDAAHNPGAAVEVAGYVNKYLRSRKIILVLGVMADKDIDGILKAFFPIVSEIIFTAPSCERAAAPEKLAEKAIITGFKNFSIAPTVANAINKAIEKQRSCPYSAILITGSFYTVGEALSVFGERPVLGNLRESL